jgi:Fe-S-cluster-containing dehydrogenase component
MSLGRRDFLTKGVLATGAVATGAVGARALAPDPEGPRVAALTVDGRLVSVPAGDAPAASGTHAATDATGRAAAGDLRAGVPGRRWVMVIDLANCDGCDDCVVVCREHHDIPADREWIRIYRMQESPETAPYWFPKPCFHCDNAPCTKVCPVGATFKRSDGLVLIDNERCIGCRFCMAACPYSARVFNWHRTGTSEGAAASPHTVKRYTGTVEKCDFCADTIVNGELPHCVTTCTMGAVYFGDANEDAVTNGKAETVRLSQLLHDRSGYRFLEDLGTEPRVFYLPPSGRRYPAPAGVPHGRHGAHGTPAPAGQAAP